MTPNVNSGGKVSDDVNVKRLGHQQKSILRFLYQNQECRYKQVELINEIHGQVTDTRKASMSRSINRLIAANLVDERKAVYSPKLEAVIVHRVNYAITELGIIFVENDDRLPEISGGCA